MSNKNKLMLSPAFVQVFFLDQHPFNCCRL